MNEFERQVLAYLIEIRERIAKVEKHQEAQNGRVFKLDAAVMKIDTELSTLRTDAARREGKDKTLSAVWDFAKSPFMVYAVVASWLVFQGMVSFGLVK